jgi:SAM-dependent methyltransferase
LKEIKKSIKLECSICSNNKLNQVINLPNLPLTGIFVKEMPEKNSFSIDQGLNFCSECGHAQLMYVLDPSYVYGQTYYHRSTNSPISRSGNDFFLKFLRKVSLGRSFKKILEVGCNDAYLLKKIQDMGEVLVGIDPILENNSSHAGEKIKLVGGFIEDTDFVSELGGTPDLILSVHTFEHIDEPLTSLLELVKHSSEDALFVIEVPGFDSLLNSFRFDQVFHQHIHYYSVASFRRLIEIIGCEYLTHTFNYDFWRGTMLIAFQKNKKAVSHVQDSEYCKLGHETIEAHYKIFQEQLACFMKTLGLSKNKQICGFGGSQMLPTLAYHLGSDLSFLKFILDDDPSREGLMYPSLPVRIEQPTNELDLSTHSVVITALDSARPILKRLVDLKAKDIFLPLCPI